MQHPDEDDDRPGYLEALWQRRRAVAKLVMLSLVVLLAMSLHKTLWYYLKDYIHSNAMTELQELALRMAYPVGIFVILWNIKAFWLSPSD